MSEKNQSQSLPLYYQPKLQKHGERTLCGKENQNADYLEKEHKITVVYGLYI